MTSRQNQCHEQSLRIGAPCDRFEDYARGCPRGNDSGRECRKQYRSMLFRLHPDRGGDEEQFQALNNCNDDLKSNRVRRAAPRPTPRPRPRRATTKPPPRCPPGETCPWPRKPASEPPVSEAIVPYQRQQRLPPPVTRAIVPYQQRQQQHQSQHKQPQPHTRRAARSAPHRLHLRVNPFPPKPPCEAFLRLRRTRVVQHR